MLSLLYQNSIKSVVLLYAGHHMQFSLSKVYQMIWYTFDRMLSLLYQNSIKSVVLLYLLAITCSLAYQTIWYNFDRMLSLLYQNSIKCCAYTQAPFLYQNPIKWFDTFLIECSACYINEIVLPVTSCHAIVMLLIKTLLRPVAKFWSTARLGVQATAQALKLMWHIICQKCSAWRALLAFEN